MNENLNLDHKLSKFIKLEKYITRYYREDLIVLEKLFLQKSSRIELHNFFYLNNSNRSLKLSSHFLNKIGKGLDNEQFEKLAFILKNSFIEKGNSLTMYNNKIAYYNSSLERKFVLIFDNFNDSITDQIEDSKREIFDKIFIL